MSRELPKHLIVDVKDTPRGIKYTFEATFQFQRNLQDAGFDVGLSYESLLSGAVDPNLVEAILTAALFKHEPEQSDPVVGIIERFGSVEATTLAVDILSRSMIGDIKKSESDKEVRTQDLLEQIMPRMTSKTFVKVGLLWAATCIVSGMLGCLIFSVYIAST